MASSLLADNEMTSEKKRGVVVRLLRLGLLIVVGFLVIFSINLALAPFIVRNHVVAMQEADRFIIEIASERRDFSIDVSDPEIVAAISSVFDKATPRIDLGMSVLNLLGVRYSSNTRLDLQAWRDSHHASLHWYLNSEWIGLAVVEIAGFDEYELFAVLRRHGLLEGESEDSRSRGIWPRRAR